MPKSRSRPKLRGREYWNNVSPYDHTGKVLYLSPFQRPIPLKKTYPKRAKQLETPAVDIEDGPSQPVQPHVSDLTSEAQADWGLWQDNSSDSPDLFEPISSQVDEI